MVQRLGNFVVFAVLTVFTLGFYPVYFAITRLQEQNDLLRELIRVTQQKNQ